MILITRMMILTLTIIMTMTNKTRVMMKIVMMMMVVHMRTKRLLLVMPVMMTTMSEAMLLTTPTAPTMGKRTPSSTQVMRSSLSSVISQLRAELDVSPGLLELLEFSPDMITAHWPAKDVFSLVTRISRSSQCPQYVTFCLNVAPSSSAPASSWWRTGLVLLPLPFIIFPSHSVLLSALSHSVLEYLPTFILHSLYARFQL